MHEESVSLSSRGGDEEGSDVLNTHASSSSLPPPVFLTALGTCHKHNAADRSSSLLPLVPDMAEEQVGCRDNHFTEAVGAPIWKGMGFVGNRKQISTVKESAAECTATRTQSTSFWIKWWLNSDAADRVYWDKISIK